MAGRGRGKRGWGRGQRGWGRGQSFCSSFFPQQGCGSSTFTRRPLGLGGGKGGLGGGQGYSPPPLQTPLKDPPAKCEWEPPPPPPNTMEPPPSMGAPSKCNGASCPPTPTKGIMGFSQGAMDPPPIKIINMAPPPLEGAQDPFQLKLSPSPPNKDPPQGPPPSLPPPETRTLMSLVPPRAPPPTPKTRTLMSCVPPRTPPFAPTPPKQGP